MATQWPLSGMSRHVDTHFTDGEMEARSGGEQPGVTFRPARPVSVPSVPGAQGEEPGRGGTNKQGAQRHGWMNPEPRQYSGPGGAEPQAEAVEGVDGSEAGGLCEEE